MRQKYYPEANLESLEIVQKRPTHYLFIGKTSSGKTVSAETLMSILFEKGFKIVSVYNSYRWESAFMSFPCTMSKWQTRTRRKYGLPCHSLPIKIHIPLSKDLKYIPKGISEPFTLPLCELDEFEISFVGSVNPSIIQVTLMSMALEKMKPSSTIVDFILEIRKLARQKTFYIRKIDFPSFFQKSTLKVVLRNISAYLKESIVSSKDCPTAIDLEEILNDNSYISVFAEGLLPPNLRYLTVSYLVRKIFDLCKEGKVNVPLFLFTDEAEDLIAQETTNPLIMKTRDVFAEMSRGARGVNVSLGIVIQSPLGLYDKVRRQMHTKFVFLMDSPEELNFLRESHRSLTKEELEQISNFEIGDCMIFEMGQPAKYVKTIPPPFLHREPKHDFFKLWVQKGGKFTSAKPYLKFVEDEVESKMNEYESYREKEKKEEKKEKKKSRAKEGKRINMLLDVLNSFKRINKIQFTIDDIYKSLPNMSHRTLRDWLKKFKDQGIIKSIKKGLYEITL